MRDLNNAKLKSIVDTASSLFWRHGFRRVTVEEICRKAGVSKMTFYKHFKNKDDLLVLVLDLITRERTQAYQEVMASPALFGEKVKELVRQKIEQVEDLSQEFFLDIHFHTSPEVKVHLDRLMAEAVEMIRRDFVQAQERGEIRPDVKPEFILYFLNHMIVMLKDPELLRLYDSPQEIIMELNNFFIYGLLPQSGEVPGG